MSDNLDAIKTLVRVLSPEEKQELRQLLQPSRKQTRLMTTEQSARYLGVNKETLLRWMRAKEIPAIKRGQRWIRFEQDALDQFLEDNETGRAA